MNGLAHVPGPMTMTKADIIENIYEKVGFSKKESAEVKRVEEELEAASSKG